MTESQKIKEFNKVFWKDYNERCKQCEDECKQSHLAEILFCPFFTRLSSLGKQDESN